MTVKYRVCVCVCVLHIWSNHRSPAYFNTNTHIPKHLKMTIKGIVQARGVGVSLTSINEIRSRLYSNILLQEAKESSKNISDGSSFCLVSLPPGQMQPVSSLVQKMGKNG